MSPPATNSTFFHRKFLERGRQPSPPVSTTLQHSTTATPTTLPSSFPASSTPHSSIPASTTLHSSSISSIIPGAAAGNDTTGSDSHTEDLPEYESPSGTDS